MAESQELIPYGQALLDALDDTLSEARMAPYFGIVNGDRKLAILYYLWNSRLAKAFLFLLNVAEVTTRNAMHRALSAEFGGPGWILNPPFPLTPESEASRLAALRRLNGDPSRRGRAVTPDDLVAALTFDFWSNLFRRDYDAVWTRPGLLLRTFPNLPAGETRRHVQDRVREVNFLRNRVAHHEPIHGLNHRRYLDLILELVALRSQQARDWVEKCSTVMSVVRTPPTSASSLPGLPLASANIRPLPTFGHEAPVLDVIMAMKAARPAVAIATDDAGDQQILTAQRILAAIGQVAASEKGLVDLSEFSIRDVIEGAEEPVVVRIDRSCSTGDVLAAFFPDGVPQKARPQIALVIAQGAIVGAVLHPLVRY